MKRHLTITIDANRVTCGKCEQLGLSAWAIDGACKLFRVDLAVNGRSFVRCALCLAAEKDVK